QMPQMGGAGGSLGALQVAPNINVIVGMQGYEDPSTNISGGVAWRYAPIESCGGGGPGSGVCNATDCVITTCPPEVTVDFYYDYLVHVAYASAVVICGTDAFRYVTHPDVTGSPNCSGTTYVVTYNIGDTQGSRGCCDQTITIENTPPSISVPAGEPVQCY